MSEDLQWLHRQNRAIRCKKHGLHFDPKEAKGCYLCLKEAPRRATPPKFLILLLAVLGLSFALFQIFGKKPPPPDDSLGIRGLPIAAEKAGGLLDPEIYRQTIRSFEDALFGRDRGATDPQSVQERVEATGETLILEVSRQDQQSGDALGEDLEKFLASVRAQELTAARQSMLQGAWTQIRQHHFEDAAWLAKTSAGTTDTSDGVAQYRRVSANLADFLRNAQQDAEGLVSSGDSSGWKTFARRFREGYNELAEEIPPRPRANADAQLLLGYQSFEVALRSTRSLAGLSRLPADTSKFASALEAAEKARRAFDQARQ